MNQIGTTGPRAAGTPAASMRVWVGRLSGAVAVGLLVASPLAAGEFSAEVALEGRLYSSDALVRQALRNGARGYVLKRSVSQELLLAIRAATRGEIYLSPAISTGIVAEYLAHHAGADAASPYGQLTPREREVLQLVAEGHTNISIGRMLSIGPRTVEKHRANLMSKLEVHDLAGLVRAAIKHGVVSLDE